MVFGHSAIRYFPDAYIVRMEDVRVGNAAPLQRLSCRHTLTRMRKIESHLAFVENQGELPKQTDTVMLPKGGRTISLRRAAFLFHSSATEQLKLRSAVALRYCYRRHCHDGSLQTELLY